MMTLANYRIGSSKIKDPNSAKVLSKSLQIRTRAELSLKQHLKSFHRITHDKRQDIFNLINDYYSRIPFNAVIWNKYQTKQCIVDSILLLDSKFNPYKAKEAFYLIEKMLINLVYLPWHKEFRSIYTYSGQFRYSISEPLIGVEEVFKSAGFEYEKDNLMHLILPDDKMPQVDDGESVTSVIFDCLLAQVIMNNIIEVYEKCNKTKNSEFNTNDMNYYSWIQAYFRERSNQTTEKACSNIAELLNNITNHITKIEKSQLNPNSNERNNSIGSVSGISNVKSVTSSSNRNNNSPKLTSTISVQDRTREFLAQQANEEDNLLTLPSDLLRIPNNTGSGKRQVNYSDSNISMSQKHDNYPIRQPSYKEIDNNRNQQGNFKSATSDDILNSSQYYQKSLFDKFSSTKHYSSNNNNINNYYNSNINNNTNDFVDNHNYHNQSSFNNRNNYNNNNQINSDLPHNDREPLLPNRYERRLITHQIPTISNQSSSSKRYSLYGNNFDNNLSDHQSNNVISSGQFVGNNSRGNRYQFNDQQYSNDPTSRSQQSSSSNYEIQRGGFNSNEYRNPSSYRK